MESNKPAGYLLNVTDPSKLESINDFKLYSLNFPALNLYLLPLIKTKPASSPKCSPNPLFTYKNLKGSLLYSLAKC